MTETEIESVLKETREFPPPAAFQSRARVRSMTEYSALWSHAKDHPEEFWGTQARDLLTWSTPFNDVLEWRPPHAKWFLGGKLNASFNCVDRHVAAGKGQRTAILWEGEPGEVRRISFAELQGMVERCANMLLHLGVKSGDRVTVYLPMVPELPVALLACARIGAVHSVVFGGFSADALADRNNDAQAKAVITADGSWRRGKHVSLKDNVDGSLGRSTSVESVLVLKRTGEPVAMKAGRDHWWHELATRVAPTCPPVALDSEHPLFVLYTSGSTGKPKGILHTTAGYLLGATISTRYVFDLREEDLYWCTADVGWVTGHSYVVYGPLANGATVFMYEGAPNHPDPSRFWAMIERHKISILYTAPTAIRSFMRWGNQNVEKHDLSSLRLLGTVGEPINPKAWMWYREIIGGKRCPIVDTWWQTETGSIMITPLPGATPTTPGTATRPFFGVVPEVVDKAGNRQPDNVGGYLVITKPWPSMLRTIYGDDARYQQQYWSQVPGMYFTGDGARRDEHGNFWIMGRIDDVLNVAGHRLSTMEIESALVSHPDVAEAAVVGRPDELKGEAIICFVTVEERVTVTEALKDELRQHVVKQIGALARPEEVRFTPALPKTRSGKIMRRLLRDVAVQLRGDYRAADHAQWTGSDRAHRCI